MIQHPRITVASASWRKAAELGSRTLELAMSFHGEPAGGFRVAAGLAGRGLKRDGLSSKQRPSGHDDIFGMSI